MGSIPKRMKSGGLFYSLSSTPVMVMTYLMRRRTKDDAVAKQHTVQASVHGF